MNTRTILHSARSLTAAILATAGFSAICSASPAPAHAGDGNDTVLCLGTEQASYYPGLKLTSQDVCTTIHQNFSCTGLGTNITTGTALLEFTAMQACLNPNGVNLANPADSAETIRWNTGETSDFIYTKTIVQEAGQVIATKTGHIISGKFAGSSAVMVITSPGNTVECLLPGGQTSDVALIEFIITPL